MKFIVKSRDFHLGAYNPYRHGRVPSYGRWVTHSEHLCACEAEKELRKRSTAGLRDVAVFYKGKRLNEKGRAFFSQQTRDYLRANDLL